MRPLAPGSGLQYTIMLEYAERGSLLQLYRENDPPLTLSETKAFWSSLLQVSKGLLVAHNTYPKNKGASWYVISFSLTRTRITDQLSPPVSIRISNHRTSSFLNMEMSPPASLT